MSQNHYDRFQEFLGDATIDDLLQSTVGYQESSEGMKALNEWINKNVKPEADLMAFDDILNRYLVANEILWFNMSWEIASVVGIAQGLKAQEVKIADSISYLLGSACAAVKAT